MNNDLMFSSKSEMWETPQAFFDDLNNLFQFTLDACATPENAKCERYFTPEMDGLKQEWDGVVWCNPPYGRGVGAWVEKAHRTAEESDATVVMLHERYHERDDCARARRLHQRGAPLLHGGGGYQREEAQREL